METLYGFFEIATLGAGLAALVVIHQLHLSYRFRYLRIYKYNIALFNLMMVLYVPVYFLFTNINRYRQSAEQAAAFLFVMSLIEVLKYYWCYTFVLMILGLLKKTASRKLKSGFLTAGISALAVHIAASVKSLQTGNPLFMKTTTRVVLLVLGLIIYITLIHFLYSAIKWLSREKKKAAGRYASPLILLWSLLFLSMASEIFFHTEKVTQVIVYCLTLSFNLIPALVFKNIAKAYSDPEAAARAENIDEKKYERYHLSEREREIVILVCKGKSNKEISQDLFISLPTVKDHIYRIFQKTAVKNRVQLSNLFR